MKKLVKMRRVKRIVIFESTRVMDMDYVEELKGMIPALMDEGEKNFVFNFEHTDIFCSTALGVLVKLKGLSTERGGDTRLCNVNHTLQQILEHTKLDGIFEIHETEIEAIQSFEALKAVS